MDLIQYAVLAIPVGLAGAILFASVLALQGKRFWGSWLMVASSSLTTVSTIGLCCAQIGFNQALKRLTFPSYGNAEFASLLKTWQLWTQSLSSIAGVSLLLAAIGFIAVAKEWVKTFERCQRLEKQTKELAEKREEATPLPSKNSLA